MQTKFIRKDFDVDKGHPGDQTIDYESGIQALGLFRKQANRKTLGPHFLHADYDDDSTTHLFVHFAAKPEVNLVALSPLVDRFAYACWLQGNREQHDHYARHPAIRSWGGPRVLYSLLDGKPFPDGTMEVALDAALPPASIRRALVHWARDLAWNLEHTRYIRSVIPANQKGVEGPTMLQVAFHAPHPDDGTVKGLQCFKLHSTHRIRTMELL
jgi:hypothetical protein